MCEKCPFQAECVYQGLHPNKDGSCCKDESSVVSE